MKSEAQANEPIELETPADFEAITSESDVVLVDFYAEWCGPCRMMEPTMKTIAEETSADVLKVDVDRFQGIAAQFGVRGVPTLALFSDGELVDRMVGMQSEGSLSTAVEQHA